MLSAKIGERRKQVTARYKLLKAIDLTDFSASERSDIGLMSELYYMFFT